MIRGATVLALTATVAGCTGHGPAPSAGTTSGTPPSGLSPSAGPSSAASPALSPLALAIPATLPLGSGKWADAPLAGSIDRCRPPMGGPPVRIPPWVDTQHGTWRPRAKATVAGDVSWPARFTARRAGGQLVLDGNGLPHRSGVFPVAPSDPAYAYNPDPTAVFSHPVHVALPDDPRVAATSSCEPGVVGVAADGIPILDGFDAGGNDAVAVEVQDRCGGHPNEHAGYHYHSLSPCLLTQSDAGRTTLVGWALDGFGIYAEYDARGRLLTDADLDACHGRVSTVPWHGTSTRIYHYDITAEFPYTVGCFRGAPVTDAEGLGLPPR